jgi:AcrR family transcriptional regulator
VSKGPADRRVRGRPRTAGLDERVLIATREAVERQGYAAATVDQIAAAAGVSKGSIYRRWPTKGVLVYDACIASRDELPDIIDSGDIRADLLAVARLTARGYGEGGDDVFSHVLADAAADPVLMEMLRTRFFEPRSDAIVRRVELAIERGEAPPHLDAQLVPAVLNGAQQYTWGVRARALDDDELAQLVDMVLHGAGPR